MAVAVALVLIAGCSSSTRNTASPSPSAAAPTILTGSIGAAKYTIEVPAKWNRTLFLYSHGYVAPGSTNSSSAFADPVTGQWLLEGGYALAASAYSTTGWAIEDALRDQVALLDYFDVHVGKPRQVIAIGVSLGGIITAGLVQTYPDRFAGAIPLCGVLAGGVGTWNTGLDAAYAFKTLFAPGSALQLVHITNPDANRRLAADLVANATQTPAGVARMALVSALADLPGWFSPTESEPAAGNYAAQATAQQQWESRVDFPFAFGYRAGHCAFTSAEVIGVIKAMLYRLDAGSWDDAALKPQAMNASATGLGAQFNSIGGFLAAQPAFTDYSPGPYPRPFPRGSTPP